MEVAEIREPVFVIGTGRSGLTPLMDLIAYHEAFAWPSQYNNRWPRVRQLSMLSRLVDLPPFDSQLKYRRFVPRHVEGYDMWNALFPGFRRPNRDLLSEDVTPSVRESFRTAVSDMMRYQGKPRFIAEYSGWSRIEFLRAIFPDARFIHIVRDGRAVAHSLTNVDWWDGWGGVYKWRLGLPRPDTMDKVERYGGSFLALAAVYWQILVENISSRGARLPDGEFMAIRYEDLVADPRGAARGCVEFCGLDAGDGRFQRHLATVRIVDANRETFRIPPWKQSLSAEQIAMLNDLIGEELARFGYC